MSVGNTPLGSVPEAKMNSSAGGGIFKSLQAPSAAEREQARYAQEMREKGPWIDAWYDPVANIKTFSECVVLADLFGDGDFKFIVADRSNKLKVFKDTSLASEHLLLDTPCALAAFYPDLAQPQTPSLAVASGPNVFIYRNLRPYYKFTLPNVRVNDVESDLWSNLRDMPDPSAIVAKDVATTLRTLLDDGGVRLTSRSLDLLALEDDEKEQMDYILRHRGDPLVQKTVVTCMDSLNKNMDTERSVSMLVLGTEDGEVIIRSPAGTDTRVSVRLPSTPVFLATEGMMDIDYRIFAACRNGHVYTIKKGKLLGKVIELESQACAMKVLGQKVVVGCMDNTIMAFNAKHQTKSWTLRMDSPVTNMAVLRTDRAGRHEQVLLAALANGEVHMFNGKNLIHKLKFDEAITAICVGQYAREPAMVLCFRSGALAIKLLRRTAKLDAETEALGPPEEYQRPLNLPQQTRLYIQQTEREKANASAMHSVFQRQLQKLRLETARSYVKVLTDSTGPLSNARGSSLQLDAQVQGLGPSFVLKLNVKNTGNSAITNVPITFSFNNTLYSMDTTVFTIPVLIPGLSYEYSVSVKYIDKSGSGATEPVRVFICNPQSTVPALTAVVHMPVSELDED